MKRILTLLLSMTMLFTCVAALPATTKAATKPVPTSITSLTPNVEGFKVKWKKKSVSGYQLQVSTNSKFKKAKKRLLQHQKRLPDYLLKRGIMCVCAPLKQKTQKQFILNGANQRVLLQKLSPKRKLTKAYISHQQVKNTIFQKTVQDQTLYRYRYQMHKKVMNPAKNVPMAKRKKATDFFGCFNLF